MLVSEEKFETEAYSVEHILEVSDHKKLIDTFTVGNDFDSLPAIELSNFATNDSGQIHRSKFPIYLCHS